MLKYVLEECSFWDIIIVSAVFIKYIFIYLILKHILTGDLQNSPLKHYERKVFVNHVKEKTFQQVSKMFNCLIKIQWIKFNNMILPSPRYGFIKKVFIFDIWRIDMTFKFIEQKVWTLLMTLYKFLALALKEAQITCLQFINSVRF